MKLHHIGCYVENIASTQYILKKDSAWEFESALNFMGEKIVFLTKGDVRLELIEADENEISSSFHIAYQVLDLEKYLEHKGFILLEGPYELNNNWRIAFFQVGDIDVELIEVKEGET